jgi:hypothetical protein
MSTTSVTCLTPARFFFPKPKKFRFRESKSSPLARRARRFRSSFARSAVSRSDGKFLDAQQREIRGGAHRAHGVLRLHPDHEDAHDLEGSVAVPRGAQRRTANKGHVGDRAGGRIVLLGVDDPDGSRPIAVEQRDEALAAPGYRR